MQRVEAVPANFALEEDDLKVGIRVAAKSSQFVDLLLHLLVPHFASNRQSYHTVTARLRLLLMLLTLLKDGEIGLKLLDDLIAVLDAEDDVILYSHQVQTRVTSHFQLELGETSKHRAHDSDLTGRYSFFDKLFFATADDLIAAL